MNANWTHGKHADTDRAHLTAKIAHVVEHRLFLASFRQQFGRAAWLASKSTAAA
jgi:hypothetical protein